MTFRPALPRSQRQAIGVFAFTVLRSTFTGIVTDGTDMRNTVEQLSQVFA
ncbi:hypothetical protein RBWH47_04006 [Rhodopirellula baltica WH47]|uniref:Uncharacterized protein n=1 Tax=Rhodopirellula baltica WH47 TaxID=991778 RepID=F2ATY3_RHOBT|nr:hypothetical protein RBWH47_04006 [Rhodopirellula baltica WH47]